jgi:hypothetical protein
LDNAYAAVKKLLKRRTNQMEARQKIVNRIRNSSIMNNNLGLQKKTPKSLTLITVIYWMKTSAFVTRRSVVFVATLNQRLSEINLTLNL